MSVASPMQTRVNAHLMTSNPSITVRSVCGSQSALFFSTRGLGFGVNNEDGLMFLVADAAVDVAGSCEVSVLYEFAKCNCCVQFALVVFMPHSCNDLLCTEGLFLGENSSCAVYGNFVVHSWWQGLGYLVVCVFGIRGRWCSCCCGCCWACPWRGGMDAFVDCFVCCY